MFGVTDFPTYLLGVVVIILLPGPNSLFVLATTATRGPAVAMRAAAGVFVGDLVLMTLASVGVASLLRTHPGLYDLLRWAGAAYLAWLGLGLLRSALQQRKSIDVEGLVSVAPADRRSATPFRSALTISLLNPKAILFFMSFFIQFVDPAYAHPALTFAVLGLTVQLMSVTYLSLLIVLGHHLSRLLRGSRRIAPLARTATGALFLTFSVKLATAG